MKKPSAAAPMDADSEDDGSDDAAAPDDGTSDGTAGSGDELSYKTNEGVSSWLPLAPFFLLSHRHN